MDRNHFVNLIVGYCEQVGIESPMDIVHGTPIQTDGVLFSLVYSERLDPSLILIVGDAGDAPQSDDDHEALLLQNFAFAMRGGPAFSMSPDSGRLLLIQSEDLAKLTPPLLAKRMEELAAHARQWREPSFDAEEEGVSASALSTHASPSISSSHRKLAHR
jgi:hypothetical protein